MKISTIEFTSIEVDSGNRAKLKKHGVSLDDIAFCFSHSVLVLKDDKHSDIEERSLAVGEDKKSRAILIVFTVREKEKEVLLRPISARYMHKKERDNYENIKKVLLAKEA